MIKLSYSEAIRRALQTLMHLDDAVVVFGQGVDDPKGTLGTTSGLADQFGANRCFDVPISEESVMGIGVGMALAGLRPINVHIRADFLLVAMNQLINMASKLSYMTNGHNRVPLIVRASIGRSWGQGAQHSQSLYSTLMQYPGLKVYLPSSPRDAYWCLLDAYESAMPCVIIEHRMLWKESEGFNTTEKPSDLACRKYCEGTDLTIVALSHMIEEAKRATQALEKAGVSCGLYSPQILSPMTLKPIIDEVSHSKKCIIIDNDWLPAGASSEIVAQIAEALPASGINMRRLGNRQSPCPTTRVLEDAFYASATDIIAEANDLGFEDVSERFGELDTLSAFHGPF